jgi:hypothetical protein
MRRSTHVGSALGRTDWGRAYLLPAPGRQPSLVATRWLTRIRCGLLMPCGPALPIVPGTPDRAWNMRHLTLADEIVVLMLGDDTGAIKPACAGTANIAIAGGILMELALQGRIDTDLTSLFIVDRKPIGDELLDEALAQIAAEPQKRRSTSWIERLALHERDLSRTVLDRRVEAGIHLVEDRQFLWVFSKRAYPQNTGARSARPRPASWR